MNNMEEQHMPRRRKTDYMLPAPPYRGGRRADDPDMTPERWVTLERRRKQRRRRRLWVKWCRRLRYVRVRIRSVRWGRSNDQPVAVYEVVNQRTSEVVTYELFFREGRGYLSFLLLVGTVTILFWWLWLRFVATSLPNAVRCVSVLGACLIIIRHAGYYAETDGHQMNQYDTRWQTVIRALWFITFVAVLWSGSLVAGVGWLVASGVGVWLLGRRLKKKLQQHRDESAKQ